jgi:hypothetical protein
MGMLRRVAAGRQGLDLVRGSCPAAFLAPREQRRGSGRFLPPHEISGSFQALLDVGRQNGDVVRRPCVTAVVPREIGLPRETAAPRDSPVSWARQRTLLTILNQVPVP